MVGRPDPPLDTPAVLWMILVSMSHVKIRYPYEVRTLREIVPCQGLTLFVDCFSLRARKVSPGKSGPNCIIKIEPPLFAFLSSLLRLLIWSELQEAKYPIILKSYISTKITHFFLDFFSTI